MIRAIAWAGLVVGMSLIVASPAQAVDSGQGLPNWYSVAPTPVYAPSGLPIAFTDDQSNVPNAATAYKVSFYEITGKGPETGQSDVQADVTTTDNETAQLPLGDRFTSEFGTVISAFALDDEKGIPSSISASADPSGAIVLHRPDAICNLPDNWRWDRVEVAVLVSTPQRMQKVMLSINIQFAGRALEVEAKCTAGMDPSSTETPTPEPTKGYVGTKVDEGKKKVDDTKTDVKNKVDDAKSTVKEKAAAIKKELTTKVGSPNYGALIGWILAAAIVIGLGWLWYRKRCQGEAGDTPRRVKARHNHDGTPKSGNKPSASW